MVAQKATIIARSELHGKGMTIKKPRGAEGRTDGSSWTGAPSAVKRTFRGSWLSDAQMRNLVRVWQMEKSSRSTSR